MKLSLTAITSAICVVAVPAALAAPVQIECTITVWYTSIGELSVNERRVYIFDEATNDMWAYNPRENEYKCPNVRANASTIWADCGKVVFSINRVTGAIELNSYRDSGTGSKWSWWHGEEGICIKGAAGDAP